MDANLKNKIDGIIFLIDPVLEDQGVPRNIKAALAKSKERLLREDPDISISSAIYALDEIANDINMPGHTRTEIWSIISELEKLKEETKNK